MKVLIATIVYCLTHTVTIDSLQKHQNVMTVCTVEGKDYPIQASTRDEMLMWIKAISDVIVSSYNQPHFLVSVINRQQEVSNQKNINHPLLKTQLLQVEHLNHQHHQNLYHHHLEEPQNVAVIQKIQTNNFDMLLLSKIILMLM